MARDLHVTTFIPTIYVERARPKLRELSVTVVIMKQESLFSQY